MRSILEHFLARKPDPEALCFNSLRCAANLAIPLFNNNCISHLYHSGRLFALLPVIPIARDRSHPGQSAEKGTTNTRGDLLCSDLLSSAQLSSVCDTAALLLHPANAPSTPTSTSRPPQTQRALVLPPPVLFRLHHRSASPCTARRSPRGDSRRTEASPRTLAPPVCLCRPLELWQRNTTWVSREPNQITLPFTHPPSPAILIPVPYEYLHLHCFAGALAGAGAASSSFTPSLLPLPRPDCLSPTQPGQIRAPNPKHFRQAQPAPAPPARASFLPLRLPIHSRIHSHSLSPLPPFASPNLSYTPRSPPCHPPN